MKFLLICCIGFVAGNIWADGYKEIYRSYSKGDHLFSDNTMEGFNANYVNEGSVFYVSTSQQQNMAPLQRCRIEAGNFHFISTDLNCEGQKVEGTMGYISTQPQLGLVPLYRYYRNGDHLEIIEGANENLKGFNREMLQGYVIPANNDVLDRNGVAQKIVSCIVSPAEFSNKAKGPYVGKGLDREEAKSNATNICKSQVNPWSFCLETLGAQVTCSDKK